MPEANFIDYVKLYMRAGNGGAGSVHFRREKFVPKGGPDGGDGGHGGNIILKGNPQRSTLLHLRYKKHIRASHGEAGRGQKCHGANGKDIILEVPLGTIAKEADSGRVMMEITQPYEQKILLEGGKGGLGNTHFATPTQQTPRYAQPGIHTTEKTIILELKLIADVGIIGQPNAGKSTLLSTLSAAKPKIASYPFTTLTPQLGIVAYKDHTFVMAEIPGLIQGAAQGKGLGSRFLRHAERNKILLVTIPADTSNYHAYYTSLTQELYQHNPQLKKKKQLIALTKIDLLPPEELTAKLTQLPGNLEYVPLSSHAYIGLDTLKKKLFQKLHTS
ncbi:MAG: GTPase ObgE [Bacteroidota bacterium]